MRTVVIAFGLVCLMGAILAQNVGIGTSTPDPSARLDVSDNQRGILIPRLTTAERNAITNPRPLPPHLQYRLQRVSVLHPRHRVGEHPYECNRWEQWDAHSVSRYQHIELTALLRTGRRSQGLPAMRSESIRTAAPAPWSPRRPSQLGVPRGPYR
jgi:hypothetical protein